MLGYIKRIYEDEEEEEEEDLYHNEIRIKKRWVDLSKPIGFI